MLEPFDTEHSNYRMKYDHAFELITVTDQNVTDFITNNVVEKNNCD